jgi:hypothetical protein
MPSNDAKSTLSLKQKYLSTQPRETRTLTEAMKARRKCPVAGPTTGCCSNKASCIVSKRNREVGNQVEGILRQTNKTRTNIYTDEQVCMLMCYDCMRSESESELGNQLSCILRQANKQACILVCLCMYMCLRSESESASHSSPLQLKGVRVISACVCARVCAGNISLFSLLCQFICQFTPWHKNTHTHTSNTKYTGKYTSSNDAKSTLSLKHSISVLSHEKHAHSLKRWKPGENVRWQGRQLVVVKIKLPVSRRNRELGNQVEGILRKTVKKRRNMYIHRHTSMHVGMYDCMRSETESELCNQLSRILRQENKQTCILVCLCMYMCMRRESQSASHSSPPQLNGVRVISACVCARVCAGNISLISLLCLFVCRYTTWHKNTHTHTQATRKTQENTCQVMMENQHFHSSKSISVLSHEKHAHSLKRWKPGKNVRLQVRQLVIV